MSQYTVLFDANVLYPAPMRDALMQLAVADLFKAKWTADIHREWIDALLRNEPHREKVALERTRNLMDTATRDCLITGYEALVPALTLPDPGDRHVLAAEQIGIFRQKVALSADAGNLVARMEGFADRLAAMLSRQLDAGRIG